MAMNIRNFKTACSTCQKRTNKCVVVHRGELVDENVAKLMVEVRCVSCGSPCGFGEIQITLESISGKIHEQEILREWLDKKEKVRMRSQTAEARCGRERRGRFWNSTVPGVNEDEYGDESNP